ncbi:MAG: hypothetical protein N2C14_00670 [Planctomycetales bacterium]
MAAGGMQNTGSGKFFTATEEQNLLKEDVYAGKSVLLVLVALVIIGLTSMLISLAVIV